MKEVPITANEYTYNKLKEWILAGNSQPGQKINQDEFAEMTGVSRLPVRNAIERLASEGLVIIQPRRGAIVAPISADDLIQIFNTRCYLEPIAIIEAARNARPSDFLRIKESLSEQDHSIADLETLLKQNKEFHFSIYSLSSNSILLRTLNNLWELSDRYRRIYFNTISERLRVATDHEEIISHLLNNEIQEAADKMVIHTRSSLSDILKNTFGKEIEPMPIRILIS